MTDIEWTFDTNTPPFDYLKANYDIIQAIQQKHSELPMKSTVSWVKGHQLPCEKTRDKSIFVPHL